MSKGAVIVTGGVKRLGKAIADHLSQRGWRVLRTSHTRESGADIVADLKEPGSEEELLSKAKALLGDEEPYALINNAALYKAPGEDIWKVDYLAPKRLGELFAASGAKTKCIVNILDAAILNSANDSAALARPGFGDYAKAKIALRDWTLSNARAFAPRSRLNAVAPGAVLPPEGMHEKALPMPLGRPSPLDVAKAVEFLLEARHTTGLIIPVDGGMA